MILLTFENSVGDEHGEVGVVDTESFAVSDFEMSESQFEPFSLGDQRKENEHVTIEPSY